MNPRVSGNSASFPSIITIVVTIAALYFGRIVLIPLFLAAILSLVLAPLVTRLEHIHFGRIFPVLAIVFLTVMAIAGLGYAVVNQGIHLASELPKYSATISKKIESIRGANNTGLAKAADMINQWGREVSSSFQPGSQTTAQEKGVGGKKGTRQKPVPVELVQQTSPLKSISSFFGPVVGPVMTLILMIVFMAFMLYRRNEMRERMFSLAGLRRIQATRAAFQDSTHRVVRYLWLLALVNAGFGTLFGIGLYFLGLPHALLWGVLCGVLRFIPYIGSAIGAALPIILAFAVFNGWAKPLITLGMYLVLEGGVGYWLEPVLYSAQTGITPLAILVAAVFWAALWGIPGLLMSTPLTVSIVVIGRYIPQLEFLNLMLGGEKILAPEVQVYQALTTLDAEGAREVIDEYLKTKSIHELYENVFIPVLVLAEKERGEAAPTRRSHLFSELKGIVEELTIEHPHARPATVPVQAESAAGTESAPGAELSGQILPSRPFHGAHVGVICMPAREQGDEVVAMMLAHLMMQMGYDAHGIVLNSPKEMLEDAAEQEGRIFYVSALLPFAVSPVARLCRQIHAKFHSARIVVGLWTFVGETDRIRGLLRLGEKDFLCTTLSEAMIQIQGLAEAAPAERR